MHAVMRTIATRYALAVSRVAACSPMRSWSRDIPYMNANSGSSSTAFTTWVSARAAGRPVRSLMAYAVDNGRIDAASSAAPMRPTANSSFASRPASGWSAALLRDLRLRHAHRDGPGPDPRRAPGADPRAHPGRERGAAAPLLAFMYGISRDHDLMGEHAATRLTASAYLVAIVLITACILALGYFSLF